MVKVAYLDLSRSPALFQDERLLRSIAYAEIVRAEVVGSAAAPTLTSYPFATMAVIAGTYIIARVVD